MYHLFALLLLAVTAEAFTSVMPTRKMSNVLSMADKSKSLPFLPQPPNLVGMTGDVGFDPVGFSNWIDVRWLREAELKHGRIAMLGAAGFAGTSFWKLPGDIHQVSAVAAHDVHVQSGALFQVLVWASMFELISTKAVIEMINEDSGREPGDFGFDPLNFSKTPEKAAKLQMNELKNGRLAMLAFSGMVTQAVLTGKDFPFM